MRDDQPQRWRDRRNPTSEGPGKEEFGKDEPQGQVATTGMNLKVPGSRREDLTTDNTDGTDSISIRFSYPCRQRYPWSHPRS